MDYFDLPGVNFSTLKYMATSPKMYRHMLTHKRPATDLMQLGSAAHIAILEPHKLDQCVTVFDGRRAGNKWVEFQIDNEGLIILRPPQMAHVQGMAESVRSNRDIMPYIESGMSEVALKWEDTETGTHLKGRADFFNNHNHLIDLKTTRTINYREFQNQFARMSYHAQLAMYEDGLTANGREVKDVYVIAVENTPPYESVIFNIDVMAIKTGRVMYQNWLDRLKVCTDKNEWIGAYDGLQTLDLPAWYDAGEEGCSLEDLDLIQ